MTFITGNHSIILYSFISCNMPFIKEWWPERKNSWARNSKSHQLSCFPFYLSWTIAVCLVISKMFQRRVLPKFLLLFIIILPTNANECALFKDPDLYYVKLNGPSYIKLGIFIIYDVREEIPSGNSCNKDGSCNFCSAIF